MGSITINPYEEGPRKSGNKDIKVQDKEIEITSNGITEVTPDSGFTALNSVSVNVNVPQSGEGGGTTLVESMKYYLVDDNVSSSLKDMLPLLISYAKVFVEGKALIGPINFVIESYGKSILNDSSAFGIDWDVIIFHPEIPAPMSIKDAFVSMGGLPENFIEQLTEITKEEFYSE